MKKSRLLLLSAMGVLASLATGVPGASASDSHASSPTATYSVTITNDTSGQYLTPPNYAAHSRDVDVFSRGKAASPGVQGVAENGDVPGLAAELSAAIDGTGNGVSGVAGPAVPIRPGESRTFTLETTENRLSIVSMIVCTNDGFAGLDAKFLPSREGQTRSYRLEDLDAGTEINTELKADIVPAPFCQEGADSGTGMSNPALAENGVITRHPTIRGVGDLGPNFDWPRRQIASVEITRMADIREYDVTVSNLTSGQYLTPPNFAAHNSHVDVFEVGQAASPGVQGVAENGDVPGLAAELSAAVDGTGNGVSGVAGPEVPIRPGETRTFTVRTTEPYLSIVSMIVCTNDGFVGLDGAKLPSNGKATRSFGLGDYDAGTEINTELKADIVPAPFCQEGAGSGTGMSNPALAENGVITAHPTIQGVGDLGENFDWSGHVARVDIVRK